MMQDPKEIRIVRYWNIELADYVYGLEVLDEEGGVKSRRLLDQDRNWAERTAEHFKVGVPDEKDSE